MRGGGGRKGGVGLQLVRRSWAANSYLKHSKEIAKRRKEIENGESEESFQERKRLQ